MEPLFFSRRKHTKAKRIENEVLGAKIGFFAKHSSANDYIFVRTNSLKIIETFRIKGNFIRHKGFCLIFKDFSRQTSILKDFPRLYEPLKISQRHISQYDVIIIDQTWQFDFFAVHHVPVIEYY